MRIRRFVLQAIFTIIMSLFIFTSLATGEIADEYQIKASYLFHFVQYTEWPREAFLRPEDPVRVCVYGRDPFDLTLERTFAGKVVKQRPFVVQHDVRVSELKNCHIAYIGSSEVLRTTTMKRTLQGSYTLTVGASKHFIEYGGMIQFFRSLNTIRFAVSPVAVRQKNIKLSSKLLRLAKIVE